MPVKIVKYSDLSESPGEQKAIQKFAVEKFGPEAAKDYNKFGVVKFDDGRQTLVELDSIMGLGSKAKTFAQNLGLSVLPGIAGTAADALVTTATMPATVGGGALATSPTGPGAALGAIAGGLGSKALGLGANVAASYATTAAEEALLRKLYPAGADDVEVNRAANPKTATIGSMLSSFGLARNLPSGIKKAVGDIIGKTTADVTKKDIALEVGKRMGINAGMEAGQEAVIEGRTPFNDDPDKRLDPLRIGLSTALSPVQLRPTGYGRVAGGLGAMGGEKLRSKLPAEATLPQVSQTDRDAALQTAAQGGLSSDEYVQLHTAINGVPPRGEITPEKIANFSKTAAQLVAKRQQLDPSRLTADADAAYTAIASGANPATLPEIPVLKLLATEHAKAPLTREQWTDIAASPEPKIALARARAGNLPSETRKAQLTEQHNAALLEEQAIQARKQVDAEAKRAAVAQADRDKKVSELAELKKSKQIDASWKQHQLDQAREAGMTAEQIAQKEQAWSKLEGDSNKATNERAATLEQEIAAFDAAQGDKLAQQTERQLSERSAANAEASLGNELGDQLASAQTRRNAAKITRDAILTGQPVPDNPFSKRLAKAHAMGILQSEGDFTRAADANVGDDPLAKGKSLDSELQRIQLEKIEQANKAAITARQQAEGTEEAQAIRAARGDRTAQSMGEDILAGRAKPLGSPQVPVRDPNLPFMPPSAAMGPYEITKTQSSEGKSKMPPQGSSNLYSGVPYNELVRWLANDNSATGPMAHPGTASNRPVPESKEQIRRQIELTHSVGSTKAATVVSPHGYLPRYLPEGLEAFKSPHGVVIFNPKKISRAKAEAATSGDVIDGRILGLGSDGRNTTAGKLAVTTSLAGTPDVLGEIVRSPQEAREAGIRQRQAVPQGDTSVKPVDEVIANREGENGGPFAGNFDKWFAGSKAVDPSGLPLPLYHVTTSDFLDHSGAFATQPSTYKRNSGLSETVNMPDELGTHFGSKETVNNFDEANHRGLQDQHVIPVNLSIKNPLRMPDIFPLSGDKHDITDKILQLVKMPRSLAKQAVEEHLGRLINDEHYPASNLTAKLKELGYDGVVYDNKAEGGGDSWIAFEPTQIKSTTGNDGSYDANDPRIMSMRLDLGAIPALRTASQAVLKVAERALIRPITHGSFHTGGTGGFRSLHDKLNDQGPRGQALVTADKQMTTYKNQQFAADALDFQQAYSGLSSQDKAIMSKYMHDMKYNGASTLDPGPDILTRAATINRVMQRQMFERQQAGGPFVNDERMPEVDLNYVPEQMSREAWRVVTQGSSDMPNLDDRAKYLQLRDDYIAHRTWQGDTVEHATQMWNDYKANVSAGGAVVDGAKYAAVRKAEGMGLPASMRAPLEQALYSHSAKTHHDVGWFKYIQQNPELAQFVGERSDGVGGTYTFTEEPQANNNVVKDWMTDVNASRTYDNDWLDLIGRMATATRLGVMTGARDMMTTPGIAFTYVESPRDLLRLGQSMVKALSTSSVAAKRAGAIDPRGQLSVETQPDSVAFGEPVGHGLAADNIYKIGDRVVQAGRMLQGRQLMETTARQWMFEFGRMEALDRLTNLSPENRKWFDKLEIPDWQKLDPQNLADAVGTHMVQRVQGTYSRAGLPGALLHSANNPAAQLFFKLGRWQVERMNNFMKDAYYPAMNEGKFGPLIRAVTGGLLSSAGIHALEEYLWNKKPQWMTWKEWHKASDANKETAYTLFNEIDTGSSLGLLGGLANSVNRIAHKQLPRPVMANLGFELLQDLGTRLTQAVGAMQDGSQLVPLLANFAHAVAQDNIQAYRLLTQRQHDTNGAREEAMYNRQMGKNSFSAMEFPPKNTLDPLAAFRDANTLDDAIKALPAATAAIQKSKTEPVLQTPLRKLGPDPMNRDHPTFYDWLEDIQGGGKEQMFKDIKLDELTQRKRGMLEQVTGGVKKAEADRVRAAQLSHGPH